MDCVTGVPFAYHPDGAIAFCGDPVTVENFGDALHEVLYVIDRLPTYVVAGAWFLGLLFLLLAALVVKELLS